MKSASFLMAYLSALSCSGMSIPLQAHRIDCYRPPILAPEDHCRAVLRTLIWTYTRPGIDIQRTWGRSVQPAYEGDLNNLDLPRGFRLDRLHPGPDAPANVCEIHIDNAADNFDQPDTFTITDMALAGIDVLNQCYPSPRFQTGWAFPGDWGSVYVTTLRLPEDRGSVGAESNNTSYPVTYLKAVDVAANMTLDDMLANRKPGQTIQEVS